MEYKLLEEKDFELMRNFQDDENTKYNTNNLYKFIQTENSKGFVVKQDNKIIGFAYGYVMVRPDGKTMFYLHSIDITKDYQGNGYGTKLMEYIKDYCKEISCYKMFLATNRSNISACKCYEKCGGKNTADDELFYSYNLKLQHKL